MVLRLIGVIMTFTDGGIDPMLWIGVPANLSMAIMRPWTIISYMFVQYDILHILFNMLWLFWFGTMFNIIFNQRQFLALYIYGGIGGAILYLAAYNLIPFFMFENSSAYLIGASAAVMAIVIATAVRAPNYPVNLLFFGAVKLKWIAAVAIFLDVISITGNNAGGHISHLGGMVVGFLFAYYFSKGADITRPFNKLVSAIDDMLHRRKLYVGKKPQKGHSQKKQQQPKSNMAEMDIILEKIKKSGYTSLTQEEKKKLFDISNKV